MISVPVMSGLPRFLNNVRVQLRKFRLSFHQANSLTPIEVVLAAEACIDFAE
jgi:hypothetical protein